MTAIGSGAGAGSCCCTACESMPFTSPIAAVPVFDPDQRIIFPGHPLDYIQGFCCTCLPSYACISVECVLTGVLTRAYLPIKCGSLQYGQHLANVYTGQIFIEGVAHTAYFTLDVTANLECYFCLAIPSLYGFEEQCVLLTEEQFKAPIRWCKTLTYSIDEYGVRVPTTFVGTSYECGQIIIKVGLPNITPITKRPEQWLDLNGNLIQDENSIRNRCKGCGCISTQGCLTIYRVGNGTAESHVMYLGCSNCDQPCDTGHVYRSVAGDYGPIVSIERDPSCAYGDENCGCVLMLSQISSMEGVSPPLVSGLITQGVNPGDCPFPSAKWSFQDSNNDTILVDFRTEACSESPCSINPSGCCVGVEMPNVVHCTIERQASFASASCECLPKTIAMLFDGSPIAPAWSGLIDTDPGNGSWCDDGPDKHDIRVRLACQGNTWGFSYGAGAIMAASPCAGFIATDPSYFSCRPVYMKFTVDGVCCGPSAVGFPPVSPGPQTLTFTITE